MPRPRSKDSPLNYFNEEEAQGLLKQYYNTGNIGYIEELYPGILKIINGMINQHFRYNSVIMDYDLKQDAIANCLLETHKSLTTMKFDPYRGKKLFSYLNRIIKNVLTQFTTKNRKYKDKEINISFLNKDDNNMSDSELFDYLKNSNSGLDYHIIDTEPNKIRVVDFMNDDIKTNEQTLKKCKEDFVFIYNLFFIIRRNIIEILSKENNFNEFYKILNDKISFEENKIRGFRAFSKVKGSYKNSLRKSLKEIEKIMDKLMIWISKTYGGDIKVSTRVFKFRSNPYISISKDFRKYCTILKREIEVNDIFHNNIVLKNNIVEVLKMILGYHF